MIIRDILQPPQFVISGVGVDIKVDNAVIFGLSETPENFLQEGGRAMRGSVQETSGKQGYAFFFQKGHLGTEIFYFFSFLGIHMILVDIYSEIRGELAQLNATYY